MNFLPIQICENPATLATIDGGRIAEAVKQALQRCVDASAVTVDSDTERIGLLPIRDCFGLAIERAQMAIAESIRGELPDARILIG